MKDEKNISQKKIKMTLEQYQEEIHERAHQIFIERGTKPGDALSDWLQAEKEIKEKYNIN